MTPHLRTQIWRWVRLAALGLVSSGIVDQALTSSTARAVLGAGGLATAEVIWRQLRPALVTSGTTQAPLPPPTSPPAPTPPAA